MSAISVSHFSKLYQIHKKQPGFKGALSSFFSRTHETVRAVEDVSFTIEEGELVGFIGPNGAGKTTTLKSLSGLLYPSTGEISVLGYTPFERKREFLKQISLIMGQKNQLWWDLPALDTFTLHKEIYQISQKKYDETLSLLTRILDVKDILSTPVKRLSLGQRMKMELIASLLHTPKVLFLDEPTIGLDVVMQRNLRDFVKAYNRQYKATVILTSHYMGDVEALCKRVIVINFGKILYDGKLTELVKQHAPFKIIRAVLSKPVEKQKLTRYGEVKEFVFPEFELRVTSDNISQVASSLLKELPIEDFTVEDPDVEDVIAGLFYAKKS